MTEKLIKLIESELPGMISWPHDKEVFMISTLEYNETWVEWFLKRTFPHENQIEQRNKFRRAWNDILTGNIAK